MTEATIQMWWSLVLFSIIAIDLTFACHYNFPVFIVSQPVVIDEENRGSLERDEQVRWQIDIPETGKLIVIEVEQGEVAFYASTETTAPNEAFYQWKLRTSSSSSVFIQPTAGRESNRRRRQIGPNSNMTDNLIPVYTTVMGLGSKNTFTLTGGKYSLIYLLGHFFTLDPTQAI